MKHLLIFSIIGCLVFFSDCRKKKPVNPDPTPQELQAEKLAGTWGNATNITVPQGVDISIISNLVLTFAISGESQPGAFSSFGAAKVFDTSAGSTWDFVGETTDNIILANVLPVTSFQIVSLNDTTLVIQFEHPGGDGYEGKDGTYTVTLTKLN